MARAAPPLLFAGAAAACTQTYTNKASTPVTVCKRHNGGTPTLAKTLAPGESMSEECIKNQPYESNAAYFTTRGLGACPSDTCPVATQTCKSYPWWMGQGVSPDNGNWYGGIGINWDGDGQGWTGDYAAPDAHYGLEFSCKAYNGTQDISLKCTVIEGKPVCTPDKPAPHNKTNSGTVMCDPTTLQLNIIDAPCTHTEYCCPEAKKCLTPAMKGGKAVPCQHDASVCGAGEVCCPVTQICVTAGAPCTVPPPCGAGEYCCPEAKHCLSVATTLSCASVATCAPGDTACSAETGTCVAAGAANCTDECGALSHDKAWCDAASGHCATPTGAACGKDGKCPHGACDTLTGLCTQVMGQPCTSGCAAGELCAKGGSGRECQKPSGAGNVVPCASAADCGTGGVCCPVTGVCVVVGSACDPLAAR